MLVVNLFGGPGTGKSTTAAHLFSLMKQDGYLAELVPEYAKDVVWEGRHYLLSDQLYIFAKQHRRIARLLDQVDLVVTDSPLLMSCSYIDPESPIAASLLNLSIDVASLYETFNVFLNRVKEFQPAGRMQTEEEAIQKDGEIKKLLNLYATTDMAINADRYAAEYIWAAVKETHPEIKPSTGGL